MSESKIGKFFHRILVPIGNLAHIAALGLLIIEFGKHEGYNWQFWVILGIIVFTTVAGIVLFLQGKKQKEANDIQTKSYQSQVVALTAKLQKNERYKSAIPILNSTYREIHFAIKDDPETYQTSLARFCNGLSSTFTTITGAQCHVAIKMCTKEFGADTTKLSSLKTITIARDDASSGQRKAKRLHGEQVAHPISENSDFLQIIKSIAKGKEAYFFSNDLVSSMPIYSNSSFKCFDKEPDHYAPYTSSEERAKTWPLEYKSTIVVPIYLGNNNSQVAGKNFYGFLCIHSNETNIFDESIDKEVLAGCADGLINVLDRCYNKTGAVKAIP